MGRALLVLETPADRGKAVHWITKAPVGTRVEFKASKRTLPQNDLMWALLTDFAQQFAHNGKKYEPSEWKCIFLHAFGREISFLPSLDGRTFLPIEMSSSDLSKQEMTDFIEFILKEAAERGVILHIPKEQSESGSPSPEPEATESPSSVAEPAGALIPAGSPIADATETPVADLASVEDPAGGEPAPSQPPAGSNSENEVLIRFAADLLPKAANAEISTGTLKTIEKRWIEGAIAGLSDDGKDTARLICATMRNIANGKVKLKDEAVELADVLGCSPSDIGG